MTRQSSDVEIDWFKWEFLRRNEDYQKDYAAFESQFGAWFRENGYWWNRSGPAYSQTALFFLWSTIGPVANEICKRWGISEPFDPSWTFDFTGVRYEQGSWVPMPTFTCSGGLAIWDVREIDPALFPSEEERLNELLKDVPDFVDPEQDWRATNDRRLIRIEIDITRPLRLNIAETERRIELARRMYEAHVGPLPDHRRESRLRIDQYESYLKVWHLRKEGKTFEEIAREMFPREMENADRLNPAIKKARSQYNRACELVAGGYRQIKG